MTSFLLTALVTQAADLSVHEIRRSSERCTNSGKSVAEIKQCVSKIQEMADQLLDQTYNKELNNSASDQGTVTRLQKSQKSWFIYRLDECSYEASDILGGTGDGLIYDKCILDMTVERINKFIQMNQ